MVFHTCLTIVIGLQVAACVTQLLINADLEEAKLSKSDGGWYCDGCNAVLSSDSHSGSHSVKVTNRNGMHAGLYYDLTLTPGINYYFKAYIKLLNLASGYMTEGVTTQVVYLTQNGYKNFTLGENFYMQPGIWQAVGGDFKTPQDMTSVRLFVAPVHPEVTYLEDSTSLVEIPDLPQDWKATANATIDRVRKADITISIDGHSHLHELRDLTVEITQTSHKFAFGSAVKAAWMTDPSYRKYQQCFYENFEWGVTENALKWRFMQKTQDHIDYATPLKAIDAMFAQGIKIRAHTLFWARRLRIPPWALNVTGDALKSIITDRINSIVPKVKGKVEHWDVNNEDLHGSFFEEGTGDVNITMWMFREVHKIDPNVKLFLSDYEILKTQKAVQAFYDQAVMYKNTKNLPMYGLSIHGHMIPPIDIAVQKYRLEEVVKSSLPVWVTELDIPDHDVHTRAQHLDDLLTLLFSTPEVEGVLLWGFWDKALNRDAALWDGDNLMPNEAGRKYIQLFKTDWRTRETMSLAGGKTTVRGFKGDYSVRVMRQGKVLHQENVTLDDGGLNLNVKVLGLGHIQVSHVLVG